MVSVGDRMIVEPRSIHTSGTISTGSRVRLNDTITGHAALNVGDRVTIDPIGIRRSGGGGIKPGEIFVTDTGTARVIALRYKNRTLEWVNQTDDIFTDVKAIASSQGKVAFIFHDGVNPKTVRSVNDYLNNTNLNAYGYNFPINFLGNTLLDNIALYDVTGTTNCGIVCGQSDYIIGTPSGLFAFPGHDYRAGYSPLLSTFDTTYVYFTNMGNRIRKFTLYDFVEYGSYVTVPETITGICNDGTYLYVMSANHLYTLSCADRSLVSTDDLVYGAYGIAVDNQRLYIVDTPNDEVVVLNKYDKTVITTLGGFDNPSGICLISNT